MFWFKKKELPVITDERLIKINELVNAAGQLRVSLSNQIRSILREECYDYVAKSYYTYPSAYLALIDHYKQIVINRAMLNAYRVNNSILNNDDIYEDDDIYQDIIKIADSLGL